MEAHRNCTLITRALFAALAVSLFAGPAGAAEVYRWIDENGEAHYSESLPPDYKDKGYDVLNSQGIVVGKDKKLTPEPPKKKPPSKDEPQELPRDTSGLPRPKALYSEKEMQRRMDTFLMLRYDSEQEILDAMNVEIKQLNYDRRLLEGSRDSMEAAYRGHLHIAANRQRAGLAVPDTSVAEIQKLRADLAHNAKSLEGLNARENGIRADFEKQLTRYRHLVEEAAAEESSGG